MSSAIAPPIGRKQSAMQIAKPLITAAVLVSIAVAAWKLNQQYGLTQSMLTTAFFWATAVAVVYRLVNPIGWSLTLRGMEQPVSLFESSHIWLHAESRRWMPGGVWGYASRAVQSAKMGVSMPIASASMFLELIITIAAAGVVSIIGVVLHYEVLSGTMGEMMQQYSIGWGQTITVGILTFGLAICLTLQRPKVQKKFESLFQRAKLLNQTNVVHRWIFAALGYMTLMACLNGVVNEVLLGALGSQYHVPLTAMIAATAIAWAVGFVAFFSPGGLLVREATLAAILLPWLPYEVGFSLAVLSRFAQLIAEVMGMMVVMLRDRKGRVVTTP